MPEMQEYFSGIDWLGLSYAPKHSDAAGRPASCGRPEHGANHADSALYTSTPCPDLGRTTAQVYKHFRRKQRHDGLPCRAAAGNPVAETLNLLSRTGEDWRHVRRIGNDHERFIHSILLRSSAACDGDVCDDGESGRASASPCRHRAHIPQPVVRIHQRRLIERRCSSTGCIPS